MLKEFRMTGLCTVCECEREFFASSDKDVPTSLVPGWFRNKLRCTICCAPPRERAIARVLTAARPNWRNLVIHESSPGGWAFSYKLMRECHGYIATQYDPTFPLGEMDPTEKWRNENLEDQTFPDDSFDIVITQDVFEHLFHPGRAAREIGRTLKPGGICVMTVPVVNPWGEIRKRAELINGTVRHLLPEQYHGNPVGDGRSLVTVDWSYAIGAYLTKHSGLPFAVHIIDDMSMGIRDPFNVVLTARKIPLCNLVE